MALVCVGVSDFGFRVAVGAYGLEIMVVVIAFW